MPIIRNSNELPTWFNLNKYDRTKHLDLAGWLEQIKVRQMCRLLIRAENLPTQVKSAFLEALALVRENPIVDVSSNEKLLSFFSSRDLQELKKKRPINTYGMHLLTARELYEMETNIPKDMRDSARQYFDEQTEMVGKGFYTTQNKHQPWFNEPLVSALQNPSQFNPAIQINLDLPDEELKKQFRRILSELRKSRGESPTKKSRGRSLNDLSKFAVLPYIDLRIWQEQNHVKIPYRVIADAIFPPGEKGEEIARETTHPLSNELFSTTNLASLAAAAAYEISENE
ncbi:MAG: DUF6387 family protein [Gammaproteobacteria bacterium]